MPEIQDGERVEIQGSAAAPYILTNVGGGLSCTCPAWRNQSTPGRSSSAASEAPDRQRTRRLQALLWRPNITSSSLQRRSAKDTARLHPELSWLGVTNGGS